METTSWSSQIFISKLENYRNEMKLGMESYRKIKSLRVEEYNNSIQICTNGSYSTEDGRLVNLPDDSCMRRNTRFYSKEISVADIQPKYNTRIEVNEVDCLAEALRLKAMGYTPVVLNMANRHMPGGGVRNGAGAQEESIFRRTNLYRSLYQFIPYAPQYGLDTRREQYPMDANWGGIYTPDAILFREDEALGYKLMDTPEYMSFVSVAGINHPDLKDATHMTDYMAEGTKNKIRTILRIGIQNNHDSIVLGAIGCGAFCNPPSHVAKLFHEVFEEEEFQNKYEVISFAIIDDHNAHRSHNPEGNLIPFQREFL